jgi:phosphonate transport system permease protein
VNATVTYVGGGVLQTIAIACASLALALLVGIPWAALLVRGGRIGAAATILASFVRAVPELVLAIVLVVALGLGVVPAIIALGIHYAAVIAKMFADTITAVRREPAETLRASGATALAAFAIGAVPLAWPGIVGFGVYAFESIVRAAVIVGAVGAGGIGSQILQQLNLADYHGFAVSVVVLAAIVALVDFGGTRLRTHARPHVVVVAFGALLIVGALSLVFAPDPPWRMLATVPQHLGRYFSEAVPLWNAKIARTAVDGIAASLAMAGAGTIAGALLAVPLALLAALPISRGWIRGTGWKPASLGPEVASRTTLVALRAIPPIALGLVFIIFVGIGPVAGALALAVHTAGVLGKLLAEAIELAEREPAEALIATGATSFAAALIALVPAAIGAIAAHVLYRFEWNVRASTILGLVGAGGIGQAIFQSQELFDYGELSTYVICTIALVLAIDAVASRVRASLSLRRLAIEA